MSVLILGIFCPPLDTHKVKSKKQLERENIVNTQLQLLSRELTACLQICVCVFSSQSIPPKSSSNCIINVAA